VGALGLDLPLDNADRKFLHEADTDVSLDNIIKHLNARVSCPWPC
jgi:hypothetical protein